MQDFKRTLVDESRYYNGMVEHWKRRGNSEEDSEKMTQAVIGLLKLMNGLSQRQIEDVWEEVTFTISDSTVFTTPKFVLPKW